jgi:hypothetical protein
MTRNGGKKIDVGTFRICRTQRAAPKARRMLYAVRQA